MAGSDVTPMQPGEVDSLRREIESIRQWQREMMPSVAQSVTGIVAEITARFPVASVVPYAGSTAPTGWLFADGAAVSRATYSDLFDIIGTTYGAGDGSTTFNLPNLKGRIPVGLDASQSEFDAIGETGGAKTHTLTESEMPSHTHGFNPGTHYHNYGANFSPTNNVAAGSEYKSGQNQTTGGNISWSGASIDAAGGGGAHNNMPPYIALPYIIKHYKF